MMRTVLHDAAEVPDDLLTTGEAAKLLNSSRQHVVNLCRRGVLPYTSIGTHRRIRRQDLEALRSRTGRLRREDRRSLWLAYATAGKIVLDPSAAVERARHQIALMRPTARGQARLWIDEWSALLDGPLEPLLATLTDPSLRGREMRQNSPFAGLLSDEERATIIAQWAIRRAPDEQRPARPRPASATRITGDGDIVVLGSQSILGTYSDTELPDEVTMSVEADLAWRNDPDATKADNVDGAIGEGSQFHSEWGSYAQGVEVSTAVLPAGWEDRVEIFHRADTEHTWARCLEPHDLCIAKLVAGREKDIDFVTALIRAKLVDATRLYDLVDTITESNPIVHATRQRIQVCVTRTARVPPVT